MKKKKIIVMLLAFVFVAGTVWATNYYVRTDGDDSNDGLENNAAHAWFTIEKGTNSSTSPLGSGDILNVADGTYTIAGNNRISVNIAGITVTGNTTNPENVLVQYGSPCGNLLFDMWASNVTIEGIKAKNGKAGFWFDQSTVTGCTISHCIVENANEHGIRIHTGGNNHTIEYTTITNPGQCGNLSYSNGVFVQNVTGTTIDHCIITSDKVKHMKWGIDLESGANTTAITENTITGAWQAAIRVSSGVKPVTITNNDIDDATEGWQYEAAISLDGNNDGSTISGNHIDNIIASSAIKVYPAWNITIANNQIGVDDPSNDIRWEGICVSGCGGSGGNRVEITGNTIHNTGFAAVLLINSDNAYVYNNTIEDCNNYGADGSGDWDYASIHVDENTDNAIVDNNTVSDGINGIQVWGNSCTVTNNTIYNMGLTYADTKVTADGTYYNSGIIVGTNWLTSNFKPTGTTITGNNIHDNYWGLYVRDYATLSPLDPTALNVTAEENYWGAADGPGGAGPGSGDDVSVTVDYSPWWGANYVGDPHTTPWTWYTNDSIQDAITSATAGDIINVADGSYTITAAITVDKGVTITGNTTTPANVVVKYDPASTSLNGFEIGAANITIQGFKIMDCFRGVHFDRSDLTSTGCTITNCVFDNIHENAIGEVAAEKTTISNNTITNCTQQAIEVRANEATSLANRTEVTGNTISSCSQSCIQTYLGKYVYIYDNNISNTNDKGINIIRPNATETSDRIQVIGNNVSQTKYPGIQIIGAPYTYVYDNTLTQCNYYGADGTGDWDYASIHVQDDGATAGDNVLIDNNTISDGINGIQIWSDNCTVTNNTIYDMGSTYANFKVVGGRTYKNSGILVGSNWATDNIDPTGTTIKNNNIHNNYWGLFYSADLTNGVTAEENWWGNACGPSGEGPGTGDAVNANVDYNPWYNTNALNTKTYYVGSGEDYTTVQAAITDAGSNDTISIADGTYTITSAINVNKSVTITGNTVSPSSVVVTYSASSTTLDCFDMQANDITVQGVKVVNGRYGFNFAASDPTGCTISNCVIDHAYEGAINIDGGSGHTISNNTISNCLTSGTKRGAIHIYGCPNTTIDGNILTDNGLTGFHATMGIYVKFTYPSSSNERVEVINNNISGMLGINADIQVYDAPYTYIYNNIISNSEDKGIAIFGIAGNPAYTGTANRVQVIGNTISSTYYPGMQAANSPFTYFYDNTLTKCNYYGADGTGDWDYSSIHIDTGSPYCLISKNTISDGINGIQTWSDDCTITNNTIYDMGLTYADEKIVSGRTYKNSAILIGSNWATGNIDPTGTTIKNNNIHNNYWGLFYSADLANGVTAKYNWWGDASGPSGGGRTGDTISGNVDYTPWLGSPYGTSATMYSDIKVWLEGSYTSGSMSTTLNDNGYLPLTSPYCDELVVTSIPANVVDWVFVELRSTATGATYRYRSMFLESDGDIADPVYAHPGFAGTDTGNYYVVVRHLNHLALMSSSAHTFVSSGSANLNLTNNSNVYGTDGVKELATGVYGMYAGETNDTGIISFADIDSINTNVNYSGYHVADTNMSGIVTYADITSVNSNINKSTQVPSN